MDAVVFEYDANHSRVAKRSAQRSVISVGGYYERQDTPTGSTHVFRIFNDKRVVAERTISEQGAVDMQFLHDDRLGSVVLLTGSTVGAERERSYAVFGAARDPDLRSPSGSPCVGPNCDGDAVYRTGFTGHEDDWDLGLVDMGGRIYDPRIGQFFVPDPLVPEPASFSQSLNAYAYVWNNPLGFVDPLGFFPVTEAHGQDIVGGNGQVVGYDFSSAADEQSSSSSSGGRAGRGLTLPQEIPDYDSIQDRFADVGPLETPDISIIPLSSGTEAQFPRGLQNNDSNGSLQRGPAIRQGEPLCYFCSYTDRSSGRTRVAPWVKADASGGEWFHYVTHQSLNALEVGSFFIGGAVISEGATASRALTTADVGLEGTTAIIEGSLKLKKGKAIFKVENLTKELGTNLPATPRMVLEAMAKTAKEAGATILRVETSILRNPRLAKVLGKLGFTPRNNGTMFLEIGL